MPEQSIALRAPASNSGAPGASRSEPPLRIALTVDPEIPVPPRLYGGIERIVDLLVRGYVARGHHVTLFAHPESTAPCDLRPYPALRSQSSADTARNTWHVAREVGRGRFDLLHSFARLAYLAPLLPRPIPKLMSYQRHITANRVRWAERLARGTLHFSGCSASLISAYSRRANWHVVPNAVPMARFHATEQVASDAPLIFLGRIEPIKGTHIAIDVARLSGRRLVIAGNIPPGHQSYFDRQVRPHLDERDVRYIGPVDDESKDRLLGQAAALLMPVQWDEPFGIVMAEALACGTPVIGLRRGAVPEVVQHGLNGFVCESAAEMATAVSRLPQVRRRNCREICEAKFSDTAVVGAYLDLYRLLTAERHGARKRR